MSGKTPQDVPPELAAEVGEQLRGYFEAAVQYGEQRPRPVVATWCALRSMTAIASKRRAYYRGALQLHLDRATKGRIRAEIKDAPEA